MSGPHDIPDTVPLQCDMCDQYTTVTEWTDPAKGWFYDAWTCANPDCGAGHSGMSGSVRDLHDAGFTSILLILRVLGAVLIITGLLGRNLHLASVGGALLFLLYTVSLAARHDQKADHS
ncbi:hypothetical protein [Agromyces aureus]|uniref:Uncharacterized protein n=1 Tax=Agromyces aureus TaxID=453304 RepID=A0A191WF29_9MICO|nr:hypothetical protein [Agromyces aureus]ANJ26784.1 hypothetical protein ATC03_08725 [Agromyces aureus]